MGEVYLANDLRLGRKVALKVLPDALAGDEESRKRLMREARAAAQLDHPNVATIYEVADVGDCSYIAMQFVEGETLADRISRATLTEGEIRTIARDILSALAAAHRQQLIHRDIKPQNIIVMGDGHAKVLDFGLARSTGANLRESVVTADGLISGTILYMSPEQLRGEPLDDRTDLFSFGVVLYEMIAGRHPFDGTDGASVIAAILMVPPIPLPSTPRADAFAPIVAKALRKNRDERYASAAAILADLDSGRTPERRDSDTAPTVRLSAAPVVTAIDPTAHEHFLKGRIQWNKRTPEGLKIAISEFQSAIEIAPSYALAYAGLADCYNYVGFAEAVPGIEVVRKSKAASQKAIELDPTLAEAHASLGWAQANFERNVTAAEREYRCALELNPNYATAAHWYSMMLATTDRIEQAHEFARRAAALDPLNPIIATALGMPHYYAGEFEEAYRIFRKVAESEPNFAPVQYYMGLALEQLGELAEAIEAFEFGRKLTPDLMILAASLAHCCAISGDRQRATAMLDDLRVRARRRYVSPFIFSVIEIGLGDVDAALRDLQEASECFSPHIITVRSDRRFAPLCDKSEFLDATGSRTIPIPSVA